MPNSGQPRNLKSKTMGCGRPQGQGESVGEIWRWDGGWMVQGEVAREAINGVLGARVAVRSGALRDGQARNTRRCQRRWAG
jgi:hypothetical protein